MSGNQFTRGPWLAASKYSSVAGLPVVQQGRGRSVASVTFFNLGSGFENHARESYANARLIAAAPELYEWLSAISRWPSVRAAIGDAKCAEVDAVLSKVRGDR